MVHDHAHKPSNLSIASGMFLMTGNMPGSSLFSKGDKSIPSNYRPISILSTVSKVLERHIHSLFFLFSLKIL